MLIYQEVSTKDLTSRTNIKSQNHFSWKRPLRSHVTIEDKFIIRKINCTPKCGVFCLVGWAFFKRKDAKQYLEKKMLVFFFFNLNTTSVSITA